MTFAQPFDLRAGLPTVYLVLATIFSLLLQGLLAVSWIQGNLGAFLFWFSFALCISALALAYLYNQRQRSSYLHWQYQAPSYKLHSKLRNQSLDASVQRYTIQTGKLIFVSFKLTGKGSKHLVFHQALNEENAFRRFKVRLCWAEPESKPL